MKNLQSTLLRSLLLSIAFLAFSGLTSAATIPVLREAPTFYEMLFAFKEQHEVWMAAKTAEEREAFRKQVWWRHPAKNNFHDLVEVSHPDYFVALAADSGGRTNNFADFFPWFYAKDPEPLERKLIEARIEALAASLSESDPLLLPMLTEIADNLPGSAAASPQRMAIYFNLVDYGTLADRQESLGYIREVVGELSLDEPALAENVATIRRAQDMIEARVKERLAACQQRLTSGSPPVAPDAELIDNLNKLESLAAATRIREHGVDQILFAQRTPAEGTHWYESFGYWCDRYSENLEDWNIQKKGRLVGLDLASLEASTIFADPEGGIRDPFVDYDGESIVFAYRPAGTFHNHLYEINVDGTGLRQLTDGPDDDIEPIRLPNGDLVFCSSRARRWVPCLNAQVATLHRANPDGSGIHMLTSNVETENTPWLMPDGRLLFMRWEYVERDRSFPHGLWTVNPDGTGIMTYWGNMNEPDVFIDAKPIPDTNEVIFIRHPHGSGEHIGTVAALDPNDGPDEKSMVRNITPNTRLDRKRGYRDPWPIAKGVYLVCQEDRLYVMDDDGNRLLLHQVPEGWVHEPRELRAHPKPPMIPNRTDPSKATGTMILADVTQGRNMGDVERNEVDHMLLLEILPKPVHHSGHTENLSYNGNFFLERVLGTVPVEDDGSAHFEVPAMRNLMMVAMDKEGNSIKRMQSFVTVQPGETVSCVGCHENRTETSSRNTSLEALKRRASQIEKPEHTPEIFHFERDVQPILAKHCTSCHDTQNRAGDLVLNGDLSPWFNQAYVSIRTRGHMASGFGGVGNQGNLPVRSTGAGVSDVYTLARDGHGDVELSEEELEALYYWLESWGQYSGTFAFLNNDNNLRVPEAAKPILDRRCIDCHGKDKLWGRKNSPFTRLNWAPPTREDARETLGLRVNISHPEESLLLRAPLATEAGGLGICRERDAVTEAEITQDGKKNFPLDRSDPEAKVFADKSDPDYQEMLALLEAFAEENLKGRMETEGRLPNPHWVREMQRNGILPEDFTPEGKDLQYYFDIDEAYYRSFWYEPVRDTVSKHPPMGK